MFPELAVIKRNTCIFLYRRFPIFALISFKTVG
jgi:hypothetical protein